MAENEIDRRVGLDFMMNAEAEAILRSSVFVRSPVLSKLLAYLVRETVNGHGDSLKSYAVAVDGLGRPETFDSASDSSARVQMVRLRKALESYYAQHGPVEDRCLYLQPGSYKIRAGKLAVAYPLLYRPLSDTADRTVLKRTAPDPGLAVDAPVQPTISAPPSTGVSRRRFKRRHRLLGLGAATGLMIALLAWFGWQQFGQAKIVPVSPILELLPVASAGSPELDQTSRIVSNIFANDLPRFKLSRVRVLDSNDEPVRPIGNEQVYRLSSRVEKNISGGQRLYLRLTDARTEIAFWSHEVRLDDDVKTVPDALVPIIAGINGPFGAIASHDSTLYRGGNEPGYVCLLKYYSFVQTRATQAEGKIDACSKRHVAEQRLQASMLAARALFTIEQSSAMNNFDLATETAVKLARAAIASDPNDALANFAMARLSYLKNDCVSARFYTGRAVDANSNSPLILANLAALSPMCGYPGARDLLDRAFLAQTELYPRGRLLLILAALEQGRPEKVAEIKPSDIPQSEFSKINYYLAETLIAGSQGNRELTARNWKRFVAVQPLKSRDPEVLLGQIIVMPRLRLKLARLLKDAGAFES